LTHPNGILVFLKAQASSLIATAVDFFVTAFLGKGLKMWYLAAVVIGTVCGGIANFLLGRNWVFSSKEEEAGYQAVKYIIVWLGNFGLNVGGVYLFTDIMHIDFMVSKIGVSVIVGIGYNYVFQKFFVFKK